jgi:hypothetical protein
MADAQRFHARLQPLNECIRDAFLDQDPGPGATDLPLVEPDRVNHALDDAIEVCIIVNEKW